MSLADSSATEAYKKTRLLLAILICYLVSVIPFGISIPLIGFLGRDFKINFFDPMFIVFDHLALSNSLTVFVLLCSMSRLFRQQLGKLFRPTIALFHRDPSVVASTVETRMSSQQPQSTMSGMTAVVAFENKATQTSESSLSRMIAEFERIFKA